MKFEAISWEGTLIGAETLEKIIGEDAIKGQSPGDFGSSGKVRDDILDAWADAKNQWHIFNGRRERQDEKDKYGTTRTRQFWLIPLLGLIGYTLESARPEPINDKTYPISHREKERLCPVHIVGFLDSLDKKREGESYSPHALMQDYINNSDGLFGLISNGLQLRLLRDSSRLIKITYLEFNLERIFDEELYQEFALLYRLLHVSKLPKTKEDAPNSLLEFYHQDSLENGSRIREKLSAAVVQAIDHWAKGFINHHRNKDFAQGLVNNTEGQKVFYDALLNLVYRILFLLTIEERNLTYPPETDTGLKEIYRNYYSLGSLRKRCRNLDYRDEEKQYGDLWDSLCDTFKLYEEADFGVKLGLSPLGGDLFSRESFDFFRDCYLDNVSFAKGFTKCDFYDDDKRNVQVFINYAALNVEEFGSIYEGLLDFEAQVSEYDGCYSFQFVKSQNRDKSGSHYTPEELVQPLIEHALMPLINDTLKSTEPEKGLLNLKICDDACGSGHILLNAARRIALELARIRTKEDNPNPASYRKALREVIEHCIYGVDANPQAVRLCKVALWLESHNPGVSLGFLDHHIKCGDSLLGLTRAEELLEGIPLEAFDKLEGDDGEYLSHVRKAHKREKEEIAAGQTMASWRQKTTDHLDTVISRLNMVINMPDSTVELADLKKEHYLNIINSRDWLALKTLADIKMAPFFIVKKPGAQFATESLYRGFLDGKLSILDHPVAEKAESVAAERRFFHWFLEFAEVMQEGGFDCFLGNPPFLGGQKISGFFGKAYLEYLKYAYPPAGAMDVVGFFVRRNYSLIKQNRALGTLATNTIAQGGTREGGLEVIEKSGGAVIMAVKSRPWPGTAAVSVSLAAIYKGKWQSTCNLDGKDVSYISTYLVDQIDNGNPYPLAANMDKSFTGCTLRGSGFILDPEEAQQLISNNSKNKDVIFPYLNGDDFNSRKDQSSSRWVINFDNLPLNKSTAQKDYIGPLVADYPDCLAIIERTVKPERSRVDSKGKFILNDKLVKNWWQFERSRPALKAAISTLKKVFVLAQTNKHMAFSFINKDIVFDVKVIIFAIEQMFLLSIIQSLFHYLWAWKYGTTLGSATLSYTPTALFETFPFPPGLEPNNPQPASPHIKRLDTLGEKLDASRREIMQRINIGLTKLYNLYHDKDLTKEAIIKEAKCGAADAEWALAKIIRLRDIQREIDEAVRDAYGWTDMPLQHGFYELDFLPENDRVRYTVADSARRQILQELLKLNHERHKEEVAAGLVDENGKVLKKKGKKEKGVVNEGPGLW